jgi:hypothetical protein
VLRFRHHNERSLRMFVRTKKVGEHSYKQLVENVRVDGKHRQRVVAHLGSHDSAEAALEAARKELATLRQSKLSEQARKAAQAVRNWDGQLRKYWDEDFKRYHGGEIPTSEEVARLSGDDTPAPHTDEVQHVSTFMGETHTSYKRQRVDRTPEQHEYRKAFSFGEEVEINPKYAPDTYGRLTSFKGAYEFGWWLKAYHYWRDRAASKQEEYDRRERKLEAKIEKLESVVPKEHVDAGVV